MIRCRVDDSLFRSKLRRMLVAVDQDKVRALRESVAEVVRAAIVISPRDTNRYVRGWSQAGTAALHADFELPPLRPTKRGAEILERMVKQFKYWDMIVKRYEGQGRTHDKWYRQAVKIRDRAAEQGRKLSAGGETSIVFDLYDWQRALSGRRLTTVREKIYGGTGRVLALRDQVFIEIHNMEPHVQVVERRFRVMARASAKFKGPGLRKVSRKFIAGVARKSGFGASMGF